jgi:hypothetical protein
MNIDEWIRAMPPTKVEINEDNYKNQGSELCIKVNIILDWDPKGKQVPMTLIWSPFMLLMKRRSLNEVSMAKKLKLKSNLKVDLKIVSNKS